MNHLHNEIKEGGKKNNFRQHRPESRRQACTLLFSPTLEAVWTEMLQRHFSAAAACLQSAASWGAPYYWMLHLEMMLRSAKMQTAQNLRGNHTNINKKITPFISWGEKQGTMNLLLQPDLNRTFSFF